MGDFIRGILKHLKIMWLILKFNYSSKYSDSLAYKEKDLKIIRYNVERL